MSRDYEFGGNTKNLRTGLPFFSRVMASSMKWKPQKASHFSQKYGNI
jgi:hypothetical protein